jgi:hypothetical protein
MTTTPTTNTNTPAAGTGRLAALIRAKLEVLEILTRLSRRQLALIAGGDSAALVKLLTAKETVLSQLQAIERQLHPFRDEDPEGRIWNSPAERAACQREAERANSLLAEALDLERQAEAAMLARRDATAAALSAAQGAADARAAYAGTSPAVAGGLEALG